MKPWAVIVFVLFAGCIAYVIWNKANMLSKGTIIRRSRDFVEYAEIFTLEPITDDRFIEAVRAAQLKQNTRADVTGDANAVTMSMGPYYTATLRRVEQTDEKSVYRFDFTHWKNKNGGPSFADEMNMLLTAVEKMFIGIDPDTQVSTVKNDIKTKRSFI